jgi:nitrogen fixation NifU-like protein
MVSEMAIGKTLDEAMKITNADVAEELGGLPKNKLHCSNLGADALHMAIENYLGKKAGKKAKKTKHSEHHEHETSCPYCDGPIEGLEKYCKACEIDFEECKECAMPMRTDQEKCPHCGAVRKEKK